MGRVVYLYILEASTRWIATTMLWLTVVDMTSNKGTVDRRVYSSESVDNALPQDGGLLVPVTLRMHWACTLAQSP
jgi:hypothetical protein